MIFVKDKIFAKVWSVKKFDKYMELRISTSELDKNTNAGGEPRYISSTWFPRVIGHAFNSLKDVKEGDRITITKSKLSNESYTANDGTKKSSFRFVIIEAEVDKPVGESASSYTAPAKVDTKAEDSPW